jgi:hypothetical protein
LGNVIITSRTLAIAGSVASFGFSAVVRAPGFLGIDVPEGNLLALLNLLAVLLGAIAFLYVLREAWRGRLSLRLVIGLAVGYGIVILLLPLPAIGDVYSYAIYGRIVSVHDANPYVATPSMFPFDQMYEGVPTFWVSTTSVYGPAFTLISAALARVVRGADSLILAYRVIAVAATLAITFLVAALAKRIRPERAPFAAAAVGLNPVVLFDAAATAHNDLLVGLAVIGALWFVRVRKVLAATALLTAGALVKASAAIPLLLFVATLVAHREPNRRLKAFGAHAAVACGLTLFTAAPFLQSSNPTLGVAELATHTGSPAASVFMQSQVDSVVCRIGLCSLTPWAEVGVRVAFTLFLVAGLFLIARNLLDHPGESSPAVHGAGWAWGLLLFTLCAPVLLPWYVAWTLPLVWLLPRFPRVALIATTVAVSFAEVIEEPARFPDVSDLIVWFERVGNVAVVGIFALVAWELVRRGLSGTLLDVDGIHSGIAVSNADEPASRP